MNGQLSSYTDADAAATARHGLCVAAALFGALGGSSLFLGVCCCGADRGGLSPAVYVHWRGNDGPAASRPPRGGILNAIAAA